MLECAKCFSIVSKRRMYVWYPMSRRKSNFESREKNKAITELFVPLDKG